MISLTPYLQVDETDERCAYALLLLYGDWGMEGENSLLPNSCSAVEQLANLKPSLPPYVLTSLQKRLDSDTKLANTGEPFTDINDKKYQPDFLHCDDSAKSNEYDGITGDQYNAEYSADDISRFKFNTPTSQLAWLHKWIDRKHEEVKDGHERAYTLTAEEQIRHIHDGVDYEIARKAQVQTDLNSMTERFNPQQQAAYNAAITSISKSNSPQMIMFLSGEGGTGKSEIIHAITAYTRILFGKTCGRFGAVLKTAPTGAAAHNIHGSTWQKALGSNSLVPFTTTTELSDEAQRNLISNAQGLRLFILDELSLASGQNLFEISQRLKVAMRNNKPFGGLHVILSGDFYQMQTMGGSSLVNIRYPADKPRAMEGYYGRKLFTDAVTHYALLTINCRAMGNEGVLTDLAKFNTKARIGTLTDLDLALINCNTKNNDMLAMEAAGNDAVWITSTHDKIANINEMYKNKMVAEGKRIAHIIADHRPRSCGIPYPTQDIRNELYGIAGDRKGQRGNLMMHSMQLQIGTRVRLTRNLSVESGLYNGAMGRVYAFIYKGSRPEASTVINPSNFSPLSDSERELPTVIVQMDHNPDESKNFKLSCHDTIPRLVPITPIDGGVVMQDYRRWQLPILPAHARTGHSVQGYTANDVVVVDTGSGFFAGDYVAISRAKDMKKIILLQNAERKYFTSHAPHRNLVAQEYKRLAAQYPNIKKIGNNVDTETQLTLTTEPDSHNPIAVPKPTVIKPNTKSKSTRAQPIVSTYSTRSSTINTNTIDLNQQEERAAIAATAKAEAWIRVNNRWQGLADDTIHEIQKNPSSWERLMSNAATDSSLRTFHVGAASFTGVSRDHGQYINRSLTTAQRRVASDTGDEFNRCFFLALGAATNLNPYLLSDHFRRTARPLFATHVVDADFNPVDDRNAEVHALQRVIQPNSMVDAIILNYILHPSLRSTTINVISESNGKYFLVQYLPASVKNNEVTLLLQNMHFTELRLCNGPQHMRSVFANARRGEDALSPLQYVQGSGQPATPLREIGPVQYVNLNIS